MGLSRRDWLVTSARAASVLSLQAFLEGRLTAGDRPAGSRTPFPEKSAPDLLKSAMRRMAAENKLGIAVRISPDPAHRHDAGHALVSAINDDSLEVAEALGEAVVVCLESSLIQEQILGADPTHAVILFDLHRTAMVGASITVGLELYLLADRMIWLLHGDDNRWLRARAEAIRAKTDARVRGALDRLESRDDRDLLLQHALTMIPLLVWERKQAVDPSRQRALGELLRTHLDQSPRLPYGLEAKEGGTCGDYCDEPQGRKPNATGCGMAFLGRKSRSFVRYLRS